VGSEITLVKNPHYWRKGQPYFDKVVFKIFTDPNVEFLNLQSGEVQIVDTAPAQDLPTLQQNPAYVLVNKPSLGYQGVWLNVKSGPFANQYLREAVNEAVNRQTIVDAVLKGAAVPGYSPFSTASAAFNATEDTPPVPDAAKVKQFLKMGGQPNGFSFTMKIANDPVTALMAQIMQNMLSTYGITMNIQQIEFGTLLNDSEDGNFQALQLGWSGRVDPDQNIYSFFYTGAPLNSALYSNPQVDKLLNLARIQTSIQARAATYAKVDAILHQQVPYIFLYHPNNVIAYSSKLTGFQYRSDGLIRVATIR
jgi:peptide/nickel transport system substrate-binding protein